MISLNPDLICALWSARTIQRFFHPTVSPGSIRFMEARLGKRAIRYTGVLIIGRDQHLQAGEQLRLGWRQDHVVVNSKHIVCVTYDQLLDDLVFRLNTYIASGKVGE